jgi:Fe-S cluster assembly protein SufD
MGTRTVIKRKPEVRKAKALELPFTEQDVRRISEGLKESSWLASQRLEAWKRYSALPFPSLKEEAWRRTDIRRMPTDQFGKREADDIPVDADLVQPMAGDVQGSSLVLKPGHAPDIHHAPALAEQGVLFTDLATAVREHADLLEKYLGKIVSHDEGKFAALAASMVEDGVLVYVPAGVEASQPLHSILWAPGEGAAFFSRVLVVVERGASAVFVHESASPTHKDGHALHAGIVELYVGDGAQLTFIEMQNLGKHVWNFTHERAQIHRDGQLDWIFGGVGSHLTKNFSEIDLQGIGAEGRMSGFYFADGDQHLDHDTQQNHRARHTISDLLFKGALVERSRSVWQGMIYVAPGAQRTDGYQANRNLLLSKDARADSIPGLEILADDVRCTHGATISPLEEEPIFYLMTRGLPRPTAERLVVEGFFAPIMERVPYEGVRARFKRVIDEKIQMRGRHRGGEHLRENI